MMGDFYPVGEPPLSNKKTTVEGSALGFFFLVRKATALQLSCLALGGLA